MNQPIFAKLEMHGNKLVLHSSYHGQFINMMKAAIPADQRKWNAAAKIWEFDTSVLSQLRDLCRQYYGFAFEDTIVQLTTFSRIVSILDHHKIVVDYITHARDGVCIITSPSGATDRIAIAEGVLKAYFDPLAPEDIPQEQKQIPSTHYAVLGIKPIATADEIKSAWRRGLKTWHPDVCQEPDAKEWFIAVQKAYDVLSTQRAKYDAALKLITKNKPASPQTKFDLYKFYKAAMQSGFDAGSKFGYAPPVRCGIVDCKIEIGGLYPRVLMIYDWKDITRVNVRGEIEIRITYWDGISKKIAERWEIL